MHQTVSTFTEFSALEGEWNDLAARSGNPFLRHEWIKACAEAYHSQKALSVVVVRRNSELVAAAAMVRWRKGGMDRLRLATETIGEPSGLLFRDKNALDELLKALMDSGSPVTLARLRPDCCASSLRPGGAAFATIRSAGSSAWVSLKPDRTAFESAMSRRERSDIKRRWRRLEAIGTVNFEALSPSEEEVDAHLDTAFHIEASGWKGREGTAILNSSETTRFFTAYCRAAARQGMLKVFFLYIGRDTVAMSLEIEHAGRLWGLKSGFDERWRQYSPGILATHETLVWACERGLEEYEFLGQFPSWQKRWATGVHQYETIHIYPRSLLGGLALAGDATRALTRAATASLPALPIPAAALGGGPANPAQR